MYKLYFNNKYNENILIGIYEEKNIMKAINTFIKKKNPNFKINYLRSWSENNQIWYDVGSHFEFFFTEEVK